MELLFLNLENPKNSDLTFSFNNRINCNSIILNKDKRLYNSKIIIIKSIMEFSDLETVCAAVSSLKCYTKNISLYSPFIIGNGVNRKFCEGGCFYFDDVIYPILMNLNFENIYTFDLIKKYKGISNLHSWEFSNYYTSEHNYEESSSIVFMNNYEYNYFMTSDIPENFHIVTDKFKNEFEENEFFNSDHLIIFKALFSSDDDEVLDLIEQIRIKKNFKGKISIYSSHNLCDKSEFVKKIDKLNVNLITTNSMAYGIKPVNVETIDVFDDDFIMDIVY